MFHYERSSINTDMDYHFGGLNIHLTLPDLSIQRYYAFN
jgi:hypothetical protein